jgi:peptidoglycan/xylan/chitin deacetylase (PgdA/CDA1 family)
MTVPRHDAQLRSSRFGTGRWRVMAVVIALVASLTGIATRSVAATTAGATIVSLTFDDGRASQAAAAPLLAAHGMAATFYLNSGRLDAPGYLSGAQASALAAAGHEIGGHTRLHEDLTVLSTAQAQATVCDDRADLIGRGFSVSSFAYPFGAANASVKALIEACGYTSARGVGGLRGETSCLVCPTVELMPPRDPWYLATPESVKATTTLAAMQHSVTQAHAAGGGWVPFVLHDVGTDGPLSIPTETFSAFLDWLADQPGTQVRTVGSVMGSVVPPPPPPPPPAGNVVLNASLEDGGEVPTCFWRSGYGTNTFTWFRTSEAWTGTSSQRVVMTSRTTGDRKLVPALDEGQAAGGCAPNATPGVTYRLSVAYQASRTVHPVTYHRDATGTWRYWETGPPQAATVAWSMASWTTAPVPVGSTAVSFGLALTDVGHLTVDDHIMEAQ